jgi:hypothetical protein
MKKMVGVMKGDWFIETHTFVSLPTIINLNNPHHSQINALQEEPSSPASGASALQGHCPTTDKEKMHAVTGKMRDQPVK